MGCGTDMKKIGLVGCGSLGFAMAWHLGQLGFDELHVDDLDQGKAARLKGELEAACPALRVHDHLDTRDLDVVVLSLSGPATTAFVSDPRNHALFRGPRVFVSLGRPNYDDSAAHQALHRYLADKDVSLLFGFGLEPGLVEVLLHHVAATYSGPGLANLSAVCGGVPQHPNAPLNYDLLFGDRLPALNRRALFKVDGVPGHCRRFDAIERRFVQGVGVLELCHDGLSPHLLAAPHVQAVPTVRQQTARWPGFFDCIRVLLSLGLLDEEALPDGSGTPSDVTHAMLRHKGKLARNRPDISFVEVVADLKTGARAILSVLATYDEATKLTGMARLTSFMAAWAALQAVAGPARCAPGVVLSHEFFDGEQVAALLDAFQENLGCAVKTSLEPQHA